MTSGINNFMSNLTGISKGRFGKLHILRAGTFQEINGVLDALSGVGSVTAGTNVSFTGSSADPVINADTQLALKMDNVAQNDVHTVDFLAYTHSLQSGTLTIGPVSYTHLTLPTMRTV